MISVLKSVLAILNAVFYIFTFLIGQGEVHSGTESLELVSTQKYVLEDALSGGSQGVTTDGAYYYTSASIANMYFAVLSKLDMETGKILKKNVNAIPQEFRALHYDHIGDIGYANGKLYCSLENLDDNADHLVVVFDTELNYTGQYAYMRGYVIGEAEGASLPQNERPEAGQFLCDGIPWCAADEANGKLYCSRYKGADRIYVYDLETLTHLYDLPLVGTEPLDRLQGGDVFGNYLYLNVDHADAEGAKNKIIGRVDLTTGEYEQAFVRPIFGLKEWESEGLTVFEKDGETYITIGDYDRTVACYLHTYRIVK
ncbi:MAG: hypothetical protein IJL26_13355 [Clostridia bacterium]|nr:hypothetical protein [Clostridia bacterium]